MSGDSMTVESSRPSAVSQALDTGRQLGLLARIGVGLSAPRCRSRPRRSQPTHRVPTAGRRLPARSAQMLAAGMERSIACRLARSAASSMTGDQRLTIPSRGCLDAWQKPLAREQRQREAGRDDPCAQVVAKHARIGGRRSRDARQQARRWRLRRARWPRLPTRSAAGSPRRRAAQSSDAARRDPRPGSADRRRRAERSSASPSASSRGPTAHAARRRRSARTDAAEAERRRRASPSKARPRLRRSAAPRRSRSRVEPAATARPRWRNRRARRRWPEPIRHAGRLRPGFERGARLKVRHAVARCVPFKRADGRFTKRT